MMMRLLQSFRTSAWIHSKLKMRRRFSHSFSGPSRTSTEERLPKKKQSKNRLEKIGCDSECGWDGDYVWKMGFCFNINPNHSFPFLKRFMDFPVCFFFWHIFTETLNFLSFENSLEIFTLSCIRVAEKCFDDSEDTRKEANFQRRILESIASRKH